VVVEDDLESFVAVTVTGLRFLLKRVRHRRGEKGLDDRDA